MPRNPSRHHLDVRLNGSPDYLGTIDCTTTSKTNHEATTPFNNTGNALLGKVLLLSNEGTVDVYVHPVSTNAGLVTSDGTGNHGVRIGAAERVILMMEDDDTGSPNKWIAAKTASGTANLRIYDLQ